MTALGDRITRAFPPTEPPRAANLALDGCSFCVAIHTALSGRAWDAVGPEVLEDQVDSLAQLTPSAFAHYLPAFMCAAVDRPENPGVGASNALHFTVQCLCDPDLPEDEWWSERVRLLSAEQREAIAAFLEWVVGLLSTEEDEEALREQAKSGLEKYWAQYIASASAG